MITIILKILKSISGYLWTEFLDIYGQNFGIFANMKCMIVIMHFMLAKTTTASGSP